MPLVPNLIERMLLRTNQVPGVFLDLLGAIAFRAVTSALHFGVFEALAAGPLTIDELARRIGCSDTGAKELVGVLVAGGYLVMDGDRVRNTPATERWLLRSSPQSMLDFVELWDGVIFDLWNHLDASLRKGGPDLHMHDWLAAQPQGWATFNAAMRNAAKTGADEVARRVKLPAGARRLLDVGGSHGLFSAAICRLHPALTATVFDGPEALVSARQTIEEQGLAERMTTMAGNMTKDDFGSGYDALMLFNVLHYFDAAQNAALLRKAAAALNPGGVVVILDQLADRAPLPMAKAFVRALSLQYLVTLGSRVFSSAEIGGWLAAAGFVPPRTVALRRTPGQYLLVATRS